MIYSQDIPFWSETLNTQSPRVSNQNGVSLQWYIVKIYHSGQKPSILSPQSKLVTTILSHTPLTLLLLAALQNRATASVCCDHSFDGLLHISSIHRPLQSSPLPSPHHCSWLHYQKGQQLHFAVITALMVNLRYPIHSLNRSPQSSLNPPCPLSILHTTALGWMTKTERRIQSVNITDSIMQIMLNAISIFIVTT